MLNALLLVALAQAAAAPSAAPPAPSKPVSASNVPKEKTSKEKGGAEGIGYATVAEAETKESARRGSVVGIDARGWMTITNPRTHTLWSFAPEGTPVYPSAVRRVVVEKDGQVSIAMNVLCQGERRECDGMVQAFQDLNARIARDYQEKSQAAPPVR